MDKQYKNNWSRKASLSQSLRTGNNTQTLGFEQLCQVCAEILPDAAHYTEIGAWKGESAVIASKYFKKITSIDPYLGKEMKIVLEDYYKNTKNTPGCTLIQEKSDDAVDLFDDESIDILYIDGNHEYEYVKDDFINYHDKVKTGGIIAGHDYTNSWPGVKKAVDEMLEKYHYKIYKRFVDTSWMIIKR